MDLLKALFGRGKSPLQDRIPREKIEQTFITYDRKLAELNAAMRVLRDHEPDHRTSPDSPR